MKTPLLALALFGLFVQTSIFAQDVTTVNATSNEISDNLDLRAVASIFGDAKDLQDFERRLNDPRNKISNLDLNFDRQVDYLRVIEAVENNTHLIILQAVLERDVFQDVATIEVERGRNNQVQVQVVGDVFMYGPNYIYEPVYVHTPVIYNVFWVRNYNPYYSPYYFNYYPSYFYAWSPYPAYRYLRNVYVHINHNHYYNYCDTRRSTRAVAMHQTRRSNGYERRNPNQSFTTRNSVANRYELEQVRNSGRRTANASTRNTASASAVRNTNTVRNTDANAAVRSTSTINNLRNSTPTNSVRSSAPSTSVRSTTNQAQTQRNFTQVAPTRTSAVRNSSPASAATRQQSTRTVEPRSSSTQSRSQIHSAPTRSAPAAQRSSSGRTSNNTRG